MTAFVRDPHHWLFKMDAREWIRAGLTELTRAEALYRGHNASGGLASARRAAGMGLNGLIIASPNPLYGRTYVDHLRALATDGAAPPVVKSAAQALLDAQPPGPTLISLRSTKGDARILEAAKDVLAHAYAIVIRNEPYRAGEA